MFCAYGSMYILSMTTTIITITHIHYYSILIQRYPHIQQHTSTTVHLSVPTHVCTCCNHCVHTLLSAYCLVYLLPTPLCTYSHVSILCIRICVCASQPTNQPCHD
eukprot:GHVQ01043254.1.p1 GENE.GHVQ01043254.1~~GHVQ01043254.1.p1  ORF type:complete len:105 (-),score=4.55 GHVQ01043254.1:278-592(-)